MRHLLHRLRARISAKLGRCIFCMRASLLGALVSSGICALILLAWPDPFLLLPAAGVAAAFLLLALCHLIAFLYHMHRRVRTLHSVAASRVPGLAPPSRRDVAILLIRSGAAVVALGLLGTRALRAQLIPCGFVAGIPLRATGRTVLEARQRYELLALYTCDEGCADNSGCQPAPGAAACIRNGPVGIAQPVCVRLKGKDPLNNYECTGTLTQCVCACSACQPGPPLPGYNEASGFDKDRDIAIAKMKANARELCNTFCALLNPACFVGQCHINAQVEPALGNFVPARDGRYWTVSAPIINCPCGCE